MENSENTEAGDDYSSCFGGALAMLRDGLAVQRAGWNGKGMFVVKQIPATIGLDIIPKMQSLPEAAKKILLARQQPISYTNQMLIVNADGRADSWVPSSSDCFAQDWSVYVEKNENIAGSNGLTVEPDADLDQVVVQGEINLGDTL